MGIPRIDVGYSAMVGAIVGLALLALNQFVLGVPAGPVAQATLPVLLVTAGMGVVAYVFEKYKEIAGTVAGVIIVLVEAYLTSQRGDPIDVGSVTAAVTFVVQALLLWGLPRLRVIATGGSGPAAPYEVRRDAA